MKVLKKVYNQLRKEFPTIRPDVMEAVMGLISGKREGKSLEQVSEEIIGKDKEKFRDPRKKERLIYEVLLEFGRLRCNDSKILDILKRIIDQATRQVRAERSKAPSAMSNFFSSASKADFSSVAVKKPTLLDKATDKRKLEATDLSGSSKQQKGKRR